MPPKKNAKETNKNGKRKYAGGKQSASKKMKPAQYFGKDMGDEVKVVDVPLVNITPINVGASNAGWSLVNDIRSGPGVFERIGNKVALKSLYITGSFYIDNTAAYTPIRFQNADYLRFVVVFDFQPVGAMPSGADVFSNIEQNGTVGTDEGTYTMLNINNRERFKILADERIATPPFVFRVDAATGNYALDIGAASSPSLMIQRYIKLKGYHTVFKASSDNPTIADLSSGAIYVGVFGNTNATGTNQPWRFSGTSRLRYMDN